MPSIALTRDVLDRHCLDAWDDNVARAARVAADMGPIGRIWLRPEIVAAVDRYVGGAPPRPVPAGPGAFHALLLTPGRGHYALLRRAFALPLRWRAGDHDSAHLPRGLAAAAADLVARHGLEFGIQQPAAGRWTLHLGAELDGACDLSQLDFECGWKSATAAMLAGLELAVLEAAPDASVMASAAWDRDTLVPVDGVADKLDAARDAGAVTVFVATADLDSAREWQRTNLGTSMRVEELRPRASLRESLAPFFDRIEARPGQSAPLPILRRFYERRLLLPQQRPLRRDFYLRTLAMRLADTYAGDRPLVGPCRNLIGVVGPAAAPPLAFLARLLRPRRALLIHDAQAAEAAHVLQEHLRADCGVEARARAFPTLSGPLEPLRAELAAVITSFLAEDRGRDGKIDTVIDLTAGLKRISFLLLQLSLPGTVCVHVDNERAADLEIVGTEKLVRIEGGGAVP